MSALRLVDPLGERPLSAEDFPLTFGGVGADVQLPACAVGELRARLTLDGATLSIEPGPDASVRVDGRAIAGRVALAGGMLIDLGVALLRFETAAGGPRLVVEHEAVGEGTPPPVMEGQPLEMAVGQGERLPIEVLPYERPGERIERAPRRLPWRKTAVASVALLVLAALGWLLAAVAVTVRTSPEVEQFDADFAGALLQLRLGGRYLVLPGDYTLTVTASGYAPGTLPAAVTRAADAAFVVPLERLPGQVAFDTGGVAAALVVDGQELGEVPGEFELAAGMREIAIRAPRYREYRGALQVAGGGESQTLAVTLEPAFAGVTIESVPAGANVRIDGREAGVTPLEITLDAGRYQLVIAHPDFRSFESPITVRSGEPLKIGPVELGVADGSLAVRTRPAGADVSVAGRYRGRTPVTLPLAPGVSHEVVVARAGYQPVTRDITVESRQTSALVLELQAVLGEVTLSGEPADAQLFVDGVLRGEANQTLALPAAPHTIEVRRAGLETFRATVTPKPGLPQVLSFKLGTAEEKRAAALAPAIVTASGQQLKLVRGGRFLIGSPRREPGRRSNETQRTVVLERPFYIATREVTNAEFRQFKASHASGIFREQTLDLDRQPAVRLDWQDAAAYCNWLSAKDGLPPAYVGKPGSLVLADPVTTGYRMPTEAEWEFAARFDGAAATRKYPWGDNLPVPARAGNYADQSALYLTPVVITGYDDGSRVAAAVGSFPPNELGLYDMGGNVSEWVSDRFAVYVSGPDQVVTDPVGPREGDSHVVKGAGWLTGRTPDLRAAWRDPAVGGRQDLGFRIARYAE